MKQYVLLKMKGKINMPRINFNEIDLEDLEDELEDELENRYISSKFENNHRRNFKKCYQNFDSKHNKPHRGGKRIV